MLSIVRTQARLSSLASARLRWLSWTPLRAVAVAAGAAGILAACGSVAGLAVQASAPLMGTATSGPTSADPSTSSSPIAASSPADTGGASTPAPCVSGTCWVDVSVATAWVKPWYPRTVDGRALGNPAYPGTWVATMTVTQKQWLVGKLETQALYGDKVIVTGHWQTWSHVVIPSQPTNRDRRGYPGWIPTAQLTRTAPPSASTSAVIRSSTAWLWTSWRATGVTGSKLMLASYDTSLPVVRATSAYVEVKLIGGRNVAVRRSDVVLHSAGTAWGATPAVVVAEARNFLGLSYLWAGTSGFGFDCSGFTYSVFRAYGVTLSRDADQQAVHGTRAARSALQPGDLVFFRDSSTGPIGHVGIYVGGGNMIDAPHTGAAVRIEPVSSFPYYAGARRYLSS
ncbi:MAG: NlpC/P60 family protein [Streptosporangiaceae bacterium]